MMKLALTLITATALFTANVHADNSVTFIAADAEPGTEVCMAMTTNKPLKLLKKLKEYKLQKQTVKNKLYCNNMDLGTFAATYKLNKTAKFMRVSNPGVTTIQDIAQRNKKRVIYVSASK